MAEAVASWIASSSWAISAAEALGVSATAVANFTVSATLVATAADAYSVAARERARRAHGVAS